MHYLTYIIIPKDIFEKGNDNNIERYIKEKMKLYDEYLECPHIEMTKEQLEDEFKRYQTSDIFEKYKCKYKFNDSKSYAEEWYGYVIDEQGNAICKKNHNSLYDYFSIGGNYGGLFLDKTLTTKEVNKIENNSIKICDFIDKYTNTESNFIYDSEYVIDKDGTVQELYCNGFLEFIDKYKDDYLVILDLHK